MKERRSKLPVLLTLTYWCTRLYMMYVGMLGWEGGLGGLGLY